VKIVFLYVGKTERGYLEEGVQVFMSRIRHYIPVEEYSIAEDKSWKKLPVPARKKAEGEAILSQLQGGDEAILLDEAGKAYSSEEFAAFLEKKMLSGCKRLVMIVGGAFGFSEEVYRAVPQKLALSRLTFSHQMVRLFLAEQVYRAMTILRNEPYHNG
jgi:23S rRNA (pseudouridine1915-N3)-methyltransferase